MYAENGQKVFEGLWENDAPKEGTFYDIWEGKNIVFKGQFNNFAISGVGIRYYEQSYYKGNLVKDKKEGKGIILYSDGA